MLSQLLVRSATIGFSIAVLCLAGGCGPDYKARGMVKGKVTYNKKSLTTGTVMFYAASNNITSSAAIDTEGNYVMDDAPLGEVKITVTVTALPPGKGMKYGPGKAAAEGESKDPTGVLESIPIMGKMPATVLRIDEKYSKPDTSGLSFTVEKGEQTHNLEL